MHDLITPSFGTPRKLSSIVDRPSHLRPYGMVSEVANDMGKYVTLTRSYIRHDIKPGEKANVQRHIVVNGKASDNKCSLGCARHSARQGLSLRVCCARVSASLCTSRAPARPQKLCATCPACYVPMGGGGSVRGTCETVRNRAVVSVDLSKPLHVSGHGIERVELD